MDINIKKIIIISCLKRVDCVSCDDDGEFEHYATQRDWKVCGCG